MGWAAAAAIAAPIVGSWLGQESANQANAKNTAATNDANIRMSREQMEFQKHMSNTAHERATADLKRAGINPLLAAGEPASTPQGASPNLVAPHVENAISPAIVSAFEGMRMQNEMKMQGKQLQQMDQGIALGKAQTSEAAMRTAVMAKDIPKAEIINEAYKAGRSILNRIKGSMQTSPKQQFMQDYMKDFQKRQNQKMRKP